MIGHWNDNEEDALHELPWIAQLLYLRAIRRFMDAETGLVGIRRGISWRSLAETLDVKPHQGLDRSGTPSKMQVRRAAQWLVSAGLIEDRTVGKRLVFFCPLAMTDKSARNKPDTNPTQTRHSKPDTVSYEKNINEYIEFIESSEVIANKPDTNPTQTRYSKPDTPQQSTVSNISVERVCSNLPRARVDRRFAVLSPIPDSFSVTQQDVEYASMHRLPNPHDNVLQFVNHHRSKGTMSADWHAEFRKWLARERAYEQTRRHQHASRQQPSANHGLTRREQHAVVGDYLDKIIARGAGGNAVQADAGDLRGEMVRQIPEGNGR